MRRLGALAWKDLREHAWAIAGLALFLGASWALLVAGVMLAPATVTYLEAHAAMMRFFVVLAALALGNRLVVGEYHGRTQLFLEALPLGRADVIVVKLALGIVLLEGIALGSLAATLAVASMREAIDLSFVAILAARTAAFALFLACWFFAMGLLGRLRFAAYLVILLGVAWVADATELELARFGPIALVGDDFALERTTLPVRPLLETLALSGGWAALALVLATVREGSIAEALAKRMSMRESVILAVAFFTLLITWFELSPPNQRPPFRFPDEGVVRAEGAPIEVLYGADDSALDDAQRISALLVRELVPLRDAMGWDALPPVRIALAEWLDGATFERVEVGEDDGVLVRANYLARAEWDDDAFVSEIVGLTIDDATGGRALWEPIEWPRDGIAAWWPHRDEALPDVLLVRALWATRERGPDPARLRDWDRTIEREGERVAGALAAVGIDTIARERGRDAVLALGRELYRRAPPDDFRAVIEGWLHPLPQTLRDATGWSEQALIARWSERLRAERARPELQPMLAALPRGDARLDLIDEGGLRVIVARVTLAHPPAPGATVSLSHLDVGPFDEFVWPWQPQREERAWPEGERSLELRLEGRYGPGSRVWLALDLEGTALNLEGTALGAPARLAQARLEVP